MKSLKITLFFLFAIFSLAVAQKEYSLHIEGFDWGPAVNKVTIPVENMISTASAAEFNIYVNRSTTQGTIPAEQMYGKREVTLA